MNIMNNLREGQDTAVEALTPLVGSKLAAKMALAAMYCQASLEIIDEAVASSEAGHKHGLAIVAITEMQKLLTNKIAELNKAKK